MAAKQTTFACPLAWINQRAPCGFEALAARCRFYSSGSLLTFMNIQNFTFPEALGEAREEIAAITSTIHLGQTKMTLLENIPQAHGIYIIYKREGDHPLYIGCSGKIGHNLVISGSTMRSRLRGATTPYNFADNEFSYGPTTADTRPAGYDSNIPLNEIWIECLQTPAGVAPVFLESLLIQGFIHQYGDLPAANQRI